MHKTLDNIKIRVNTSQGLEIIELFTKITESKNTVPIDWLKTLDNYFIVIHNNLLSVCLSEDYFNRLSFEEISTDYYINNNGVIAYNHSTLNNEYIRSKAKELIENNKNITLKEMIETVYADEPIFKDAMISLLDNKSKGL